MKSYFNIGKLVAVHGLQGELVLQHTLGKKTSLKGLTAIYLEEKKDSFLPWFVSAVKIKSETEVYLQLEDLKTREAAKPFVGKTVWFTESDHHQFAARNAPGSLLGYTVINHKEKLGPILEVIEQPHQLLGRLDIQGKEVLIPLHEQTLKKISHAKKEVWVELPEGLIEMYLGS